MSWCDECGAEHRPIATTCVFCDGPIVDTPPSPAGAVDHDLTSIDIADLDGAQRSMLDLLTRSEGLQCHQSADEVQVRASDAEAAREIVEQLRRRDPLDVDDVIVGSEPVDDDPLLGGSENARIASTSIRVGCRVLDQFLAGLLATLLAVVWGFLGDESRWSGTVTWLVVLGIETALVASYGWNFAKLVVGLRVVDETGAVPGWRRSVRRTAVLSGPVLLVTLIADGVAQVDRSAASVVLWGTVVWLLAVIWSIANDRLRQGWHDRVAGTYVVHQRSAARR